MNLAKKVVFLDASVLFSALYSPTGGSYALITSIKNRLIRGITSQTVIEELYENITKLGDTTQKEIDDFIISHHILVCDHVTVDELTPWIGKIEEKDIHIVVGALSTSCHYLVTLDKKHLHNTQAQSLCKNIKIVNPKELLAIIKSF